MFIKTLTKKEIFRLYNSELRSHFPPSELKCLDRIHRMVDQGIYRVDAVYDQAVRQAYAFSAGYDNCLNLLDYFAVKRTMRGKGIGSRFLNELKKRSKASGYIIEVESVDATDDHLQKRIRRRRIDFYVRNGARMTSVRSVLFGETFRIMVLPAKSAFEREDENIATSYRSLYKRMFPEGLSHKQLSVRTESS